MNRITTGILDIDEQEINAVNNVLKSGMLSSNPIIEEFEQKIANMHGKKYGILVGSGQDALEVSLILAKVKLLKNQLRVLVPSTTYAATIWSIINTNNIPVFCDIDENYVIDYNKTNEDYDIILSVDLCGYAIDSKIRNLGKFIIEDACQAVGNKLCNYGDIVCVSFYVSHIITTGVGGMLCLDDEELCKYARSYISHGRTYEGAFTKFNDKWYDRFMFDKVGISSRLSAIEAAMGIVQAHKIDNMIKKRKENAMYLSHRISDRFKVPDDEYINKCVFQFYPILIKDNNIKREDFLKFLFEKGIDSRVLFSLTNQDILKRLYNIAENNYSISKNCNENGFIIGCHQKLTKENLNYIVECFNKYKE